MKTLLRNSAVLSSIALCLACAGTQARADFDGSPEPSPSVSASPDPTPSASPSADPSPTPSPSATVSLDPDQLRTLMIDGNPSILSALNSVYQAKDQESIARNDLLPGASLSGVIGAMSGPSFILSSVDFLVPFLLPSNWFNFEASQDDFNAEVVSYKIVELNTYASIYALYETVVLDENLLGILNQQAEDWSEILTTLNAQNAATGLVPPQDLETAQASYDAASAQVSSMEQFIQGDVAQLRYALGLPLSTEIVVDASSPTAEVPASQYEDTDVSTAVADAVQIAPEAQQLNDLISASDSGKWSGLFALVNSVGFMAGDPYSAGGTATLPDLGSGQVRGSIDLGSASFPEYSLSEDQTDAIQISLQELTGTLTETLEGTLSAITDTKTQIANYQNAVQNESAAFESDKTLFGQGLATIQTLLTDRNQLLSDQTQAANSQGQLDQLRITLERTMLEGEFGQIPGCAMTEAPSENIIHKIWDGILGIFSQKHNQQTLDQVCHATS